MMKITAYYQMIHPKGMPKGYGGQRDISADTLTEAVIQAESHNSHQYKLAMIEINYDE